MKTTTIPDRLNGYAPGVPTPNMPVFWDAQLAYQQNINTIERWLAHHREYLPEGCKFDEAAIMVPGPYHLTLLKSVLRGQGWEHFNAASDLVYTNPFGTRYFVQYDFFRHELKEYRLEVMRPGLGAACGLPGFSPLHASLWENGRVPVTAGTQRFPVPHLSFKPIRRVLSNTSEREAAGREPRLQSWGQAYGAAVQHLRDKGFIHAQTCQSTYGRFGYYIHQDVQRQIYVKPRVNMRDEATA